MRARIALILSLALGCGKPEPVTAPSVPEASDGGVAASTPPPALADAGSGLKTLYVRDQLAECEGEGPTTCMQVRESEQADWTLFYGSIDGFTYEPGYSYELRVELKDRARPPQDSPSRKVRLVEIVSKRRPAD